MLLCFLNLLIYFIKCLTRNWLKTNLSKKTIQTLNISYKNYKSAMHCTSYFITYFCYVLKFFLEAYHFKILLGILKICLKIRDNYNK